MRLRVLTPRNHLVRQGDERFFVIFNVGKCGWLPVDDSAGEV